MLARDVSGFHRKSFDCLANEKARAFIKANNRERWISGQPIEPKYLFHPGDERSVYLPDAPGLLEVRLEFVFFSICLAAV